MNELIEVFKSGLLIRMSSVLNSPSDSMEQVGVDVSGGLQLVNLVNNVLELCTKDSLSDGGYLSNNDMNDFGGHLVIMSGGVLAHSFLQAGNFSHNLVKKISLEFSPYFSLLHHALPYSSGA